MEKGKVKLDYKGNLEGASFAFNGMNFGVDPKNLPIESKQCVDVCNCNIDSKGNVYRRNGYTSIITGNVANSWSNGQYIYCTLNGILCYIIIGSSLSNIYVINSVPQLYGNVEFKQINDVVVFSDGTTIGILEGITATILNQSVFDV